MNDLEMLMLLKGASASPLNEYTATGNPLSFETNKAKPLNQLLIPWTPTQSGSGDPSPTNVRPIYGVSGVTAYRAGNNLAQFAPVVMTQDREKTGLTFHAINKSLVHIKGKATANTYLTEGNLETNLFLKAGTYTLSTNLPLNSTSRSYLYSKDATISYHAAYDGHPATITLADDVPNVNVQIMVNNGAEIDMDVWVMLVRGNTAETYSPYSGTSYPVTFPALGNNLFDKSAITAGKTWWKGNKVDSIDNNASAKIPVEPGETYTLVRTHNRQGTMCYFDSDGVYVNQDIEHWGLNPSTYTIPNGIYYVGFTVLDDSLDTAMFVKGSSAGSYEPYTNTVYGGSLDVTTGVLTVDRAEKTLNGSETGWNSYTHESYGTSFYINITGKKAEKLSSICDAYKNIINCFGVTGYGLYGVFSDHETLSRLYFRAPNENVTDLVGFKAWLADNPIQVVYPLATPLTYQLTPQQVTALIGTNTIWSDTNGSNTAKYLKKG